MMRTSGHLGIFAFRHAATVPAVPDKDVGKCIQEQDSLTYRDRAVKDG
jgi:hypothetical protein